MEWRVKIMGIIIIVLLVLLLIASIASGFAGIFLPFILIGALLAFVLLDRKKGSWY